MTQSTLKYEGTVTAIGPFVQEFLDHKIIVLFGLNAPEELAEFAILQDGTSLKEEIEAGDQVCIDETCFEILAVGEVANENLKNLGHLVLKFNGHHEVEMPGDVCVVDQDLPPIEVGTVFKLLGRT
ncbi:MAG: PTS glucitol/sorbitol transporter subunit IIA [Ardenticatenaceae bacterium]|nr:PTS glucitol/sorbitol transporter subunit IIA [Ardenticatenaceae bacterium]